ncbi:unnamed protein product [Alternaria alternata]
MFCKEALDKGKRMVRVFKRIMIRRSFASAIDGKRIGDSLPEVQHLTIECDYSPLERQYYETFYMDISSSLVRRVPGKAAVAWNTTSYRKMCLISSWLGFIYLLDYKVPYLKKF